MKRKLRFVAAMALVATTLSGCLIVPWDDDGGGGYYGHHHHRGYHDDYRGRRW